MDRLHSFAPPADVSSNYDRDARVSFAGIAGEAAGRVLILNSRRLYREALHAAVAAVLSGAAISSAATVAEAERTLKEGAVDLLVTEIMASDGDVLEKVPEWTRHDRTVRKVFVVSHRSPYLAEVLRRLNVSGLFDDRECAETFKAALREVADGGTYWGRHDRENVESASDVMWRSLTPAEKVILATVGDGTDDKAAAVLLGRSEGTVRRVRESLHAKLLVHHRGELMQKAVELGCVVPTPAGIVRPGYRSLVETYRCSSSTVSTRGRAVGTP